MIRRATWVPPFVCLGLASRGLLDHNFLAGLLLESPPLGLILAFCEASKNRGWASGK